MTEKNQIVKALPAPTAPRENMQGMEEVKSVDSNAVAGTMEWYFLMHRISIGYYIPEPKYLMEFNGVGCFPRGDISVLKAPKKSGKTMALACMIAALLKGELWGMKAKENDTKIIHFDNEQSVVSTYKFYQRVLKMAGHEGEDIHERFETLNLRELSIEERLKLIEYAIKTYKPDFVSIDGIVDICDNFNELGNSDKVVAMLMNFSTMYDCHIIGVIHTNPGNDNGKARGHLGTIAENKAFETLQLSKDSMGIFTVSSASAREMPMPSWSFRFDEEGNLVSADDYAYMSKEEIKAQKEEKKKTEIISYIDEAIMQNGGSAEQGEIVDFLMNKLNLEKSAVYRRIGLVKDYYQVDGKTFSMKTQTRDLENPVDVWSYTDTTDNSIF